MDTEIKNRKILVIEDDEDINRLLVHILKNSEYEPVSAYSGSEALLRLSMEEYDLILLDLMLPGVTGEELMDKIRIENGSNVPVIIISARTTLEDKVTLLHKGADDYITKPFEKEEVLARVEARLRRYQNTVVRQEKDEYLKGDLTLNKKDRLVKLKNQEISLTISEFDILSLLMSEPDKIFSKAEIYEKIWHGTYLGEDNTISVHISNIRSKLQKYDENEYIKTIWGIGFKMA
ncbi:response regulator transcription factor [Anaeromicropila herbilytica]|uniref:Stage 0 sporulation protein A homolog n=1 Tax=Anaeromicropila herbilytica TaxID=2785025 RepID=A0A7R7IC45_9FIRM|nr:response regulator transcription factor [Anaeromicropila herbilytica]BCN30217.1 DNA-binding response regulator [Anaeromicropila herbilytica]